MEAHILGFPRIGADRELKRALESYWKGGSSLPMLTAAGDALKERHWHIQKEAGLSLAAVGDFSFYDHVLDTIAMLGMTPRRFADSGSDMDRYFCMARGDADANVPAMEMTKWFDTNYHYLVPEFTPDMVVRRSNNGIVEETRRARALGFSPKPVLLGPITLLCLGREHEGADRWRYLDAVVSVYCEVIAEMAPLCDWIQIDEPILCADLPGAAREAFVPAWRKLKMSAAGSRLLLATYFGALGENLALALESGCDGLHLDLAREKNQLNEILELLPDTIRLSAGVVNGRNIWKNDLGESLAILERIEKRIGTERMLVASGCSLLHVPIDLDLETGLDPELGNWMAFAVQKCREIGVLRDVMEGKDRENVLRENAAALTARRASPRVFREDVRRRAASVTEAMLSRRSPYPVRRERRKTKQTLPMLPTTTIGSFPQTDAIRSARSRFAQGRLDRVSYEEILREEIRAVVAFQEEAGLDVFVHGEPERTDMVEYFGRQLEGFHITGNGWVQSYGSRCVKPPVLFGDVARPAPMTVDWIRYAQSLTRRPMKGMLTGPVTILNWSFVRDDLERPEVCRQIALAVRDEVLDLERAGIHVIQIDEAALREGLPLRRGEADAYLRWAVDCFRLSVSGVADETQIHTHMCYSEFGSIVRWIAAMDADVISIESSRSGMRLLEAFREFEYPNETGPGVYDIHSPRVPEVEEIAGLIRAAVAVIPAERLWINPDCGLKTRGWPETKASLRNMAAAARLVRLEVKGVSEEDSRQV